MNPETMEPYGLALIDFYNGDAEATFLVCRDDGSTDRFPVRTFFRGSMDMDIDRVALDHCRGRVLDVGAGTGLHSLHLQNRGLPVVALDISAEACEIMRKQGLKNVSWSNIWDFRAEPFDTILILGRSIGMVEDLAGLDRFLTDIHRLVKIDGQILLNSQDVRYTTNPVHLAYYEANRRAGHYFGEVRLHFEYKGMKGSSHGWLLVDSEALAEHSLRAGWSCEILIQQQDGNYLTKLARTT